MEKGNRKGGGREKWALLPWINSAGPCRRVQCINTLAICCLLFTILRCCYQRFLIRFIWLQYWNLARCIIEYVWLGEEVKNWTRVRAWIWCGFDWLFATSAPPPPPVDYAINCNHYSLTCSCWLVQPTCFLCTMHCPSLGEILKELESFCGGVFIDIDIDFLLTVERNIVKSVLLIR